MTTRKNILFLTAIGVLIISAIACLFIFRSAAPLKLPNDIRTVAAGYPYATKLKDSIAPNAYLCGVVVDLDSTNGNFQTQTICYGFRIASENRTILVLIDNASHTAFPAVTDDPKRFPVPPPALRQLNLSEVSKDVPEVLDVARASDLGEFCRITPPKDRDVDLWLFNGDSGLIWLVAGDGWDEKGPIADLSIQINPKTGAVINHSLQKGVGR